MARQSFDIIVLGVGGMGSAAVFELARRGRKVLGLEQFTLAHDKGSSHGQTRIIRTAYFEHPNYVPLVRRAFQRWYDLEQRCGRHLLTECGCLNIGKPDSELIMGVRRAASEHGLVVEHLAGDDLQRRFPLFHFEEEYLALLERQAGFLNVEECVRSHVQEAGKLGAEIHEQEPVTEWGPDGTGVRVQTAQATYLAQHLVITAGAWTGRILADLGLPLTVTRKVQLWFGTRDDRLFRRDVFPIYLVYTPTGCFYGFPVLDSQGHKIARHDDGDVVTDPTQVNRTLLPSDEMDARAFLGRHLPQANGPLKTHQVCLYTMTPDRHFIIDLHPAHAQVSLAAGFSGHGFKFASVVGEILADLAEKGRTELPIDMFKMSRFG